MTDSCGDPSTWLCDMCKQCRCKACDELWHIFLRLASLGHKHPSRRSHEHKVWFAPHVHTNTLLVWYNDLYHALCTYGHRHRWFGTSHGPIAMVMQCKLTLRIKYQQNTCIKSLTIHGTLGFSDSIYTNCVYTLALLYSMWFTCPMCVNYLFQILKPLSIDNTISPSSNSLD